MNNRGLMLIVCAGLAAGSSSAWGNSILEIHEVTGQYVLETDGPDNFGAFLGGSIGSPATSWDDPASFPVMRSASVTSSDPANNPIRFAEAQLEQILDRDGLEMSQSGQMMADAFLEDENGPVTARVWTTLSVDFTLHQAAPVEIFGSITPGDSFGMTQGRITVQTLGAIVYELDLGETAGPVEKLANLNLDAGIYTWTSEFEVNAEADRSSFSQSGAYASYISVVPLPAAGWAGLALLGAMGGVAGVRRKLSIRNRPNA